MDTMLPFCGRPVNDAEDIKMVVLIGRAFFVRVTLVTVFRGALKD